MSTCQNGWPIVGPDKITDRAVLGVEFPNGWLRGDVDVIFTHLIGRLHREVEPMQNPGCWGYFVKKIEGSNEYSNHSGGCAIDYNAPKHPMGSRNTYSPAKRDKIRAILADLDHVVRWGGDYTGRPDDMHFEINKSAAAVKRVADDIREASMATDITPSDANGNAILARSIVPKDGGAGNVTALEALRQAQVAKNRVTELCVGVTGTIPPHMNGDGRSIYTRLDALEDAIATLTATVNNAAAIITKLDADPADEPPQVNPIVIGTRWAIAHP